MNRLRVYYAKNDGTEFLVSEVDSDDDLERLATTIDPKYRCEFFYSETRWYPLADHDDEEEVEAR